MENRSIVFGSTGTQSCDISGTNGPDFSILRFDTQRPVAFKASGKSFESIINSGNAHSPVKGITRTRAPFANYVFTAITAGQQIISLGNSSDQLFQKQFAIGNCSSCRFN